MIVKGTKQLGSFKKGINLYVPKKKIVIPPAPSGIPVASTANVLVDGFSLSKQSSTLYIGEVVTDVEDCGGNPDYADISLRGELEFTGGSWRYLYGRWGGCVGGWWGGAWQTTYTNASTNANFIPTTGWSPSITITAA